MRLYRRGLQERARPGRGSRITTAITESVHYEGFYETTGNAYALKAQYSEVVHTAADGTPYVVTFPISYVEISEGGAAVYLAQGVYHVTISGTGQPVATVEHDSIPCVG